MSSAFDEIDPGLSKPEEPFGGVNNGVGESWPASRADEDQNRPPAEATSDAEAKNTSPKPQRHYPPRTCRICLETVLPTYEPAKEGIAALLDPMPRVSYISSEPQAGRLIRPCKCRGSSRYVHEGCLQSWRHADRKYSRRNFWECPTCGFRYKLERMRWARWITSPFTQVLLTFVIMVAAIFVFGFIADPIIDIFLGPIEPLEEIPEDLQDLYDAPWTVHFIKGMASMGLLGVVKVLTLPSFLWNIRPTGVVRVGGRRGRDHVETFTVTLIFAGLITIMMAVWSWVRDWSRRGLEKAGERVADVQGDDDDFEEESIAGQSTAQASTNPEGETRKTQ